MSEADKLNACKGIGSYLSGFAIPGEVLTIIFASLSDRTLIETIPLVCHCWKNLSRNYHFWHARLKSKNIIISNSRLMRIKNSWSEQSTVAIVQSLCLYRDLFQHNLIKNPSGAAGFQNWNFQQKNFVIVENPPVGCDPIPEEACLPTQHCFVSSYIKSAKTQKICLRKRKITSEAIQLLQPSIQVSEWVSARFDCGAVNCIDVYVTSDNKKLSKSFEIRWNDADYGRVKWSHMYLEIDYEKLPKNLSQIVYRSTGNDTQYWHGNYGPKTAGSSIVLNIATEVTTELLQNE